MNHAEQAIRSGGLTVVGLITARGGSKGIPRKNIRELGGKPLIAWTIEAALACGGLSRVVVSTDDADIAVVAKAAGAEIPFMRPAHLAEDETPGIAPVLHAMDMLPEAEAILLLQPTSPLRSSADISGLLSMASEKKADSIVSVCTVEDHPFWTYAINDALQLHRPDGLPHVPRRQDLPPRYVLNGAMYFAKADWLRCSGQLICDKTLGYVMPAERSIDIDSLFDWEIAEHLMSSDTCL